MTSDFLHPFNSKSSSLFFNVLVHISSTKQLHEDMELINFLNRVMFSHKIFILHNIWMLQILCNAKFTEHFLKNLLSQFRVFINLSGLINILSTKTFNFDFVNITLRPWTQLSPAFYIKKHPTWIKWSIKNLHILT